MQKIKLKEKLAKEIVDELDDCANGDDCIADKIQAAYLMGFDKSLALAITKAADYTHAVLCRRNQCDGFPVPICNLVHDLNSIGDEEV